ncbi:sensor histidine kinase [Arthrobacter globiformis]|uniref:sensor histidine kinase n=1 Tax=Arthrobacter globiformis TaxID=1665 RepID=UPI00277E9242|nr:ATP-binding protein [Arthrobacter globiformis]MDQ0864488.1 two-component system sensor histidine kinase UhpB [Arthrobacter globiformis]
MGHAPALDEVTAEDRIDTDHQRVDFYALGLAGCIDRLTTPLRQRGTSIRWETPHHGIEIPATAAALLYHSAEEILSNAFKYAHATQLTVRLAAVYHGIRLTITDNGAGFDIQSLGHHGFGVRLMVIAVHEAGGTITIDTAPGTGTGVTITLPLD